MKKLINYLSVFTLFACTYSCTKDFGDINTDPSVVVTPDIKFLLSYSEDKMVTYQGSEWVYETMEQLFRYTQHVTASPYEITDNVNSRYSNFYTSIMPNLLEIRRQIAAKANTDAYKAMDAISHVVQVWHGLKVTDMNGSIPYSEAIQGRYEDNFSPVFDTQQSLFDTWLGELDAAITALSDNAAPQESYGTSDIFYGGDQAKWIMLANTLKLRIAARLENQDIAKTQAIFQQVMQDPTGPIATDDAQVVYLHPTYSPFGGGGDINYRSTRYASLSIMSFLKKTHDPRLAIYFEANDLQGSYKDTLQKYRASLPSFIDPGDPLIRYQGAPADWSTNSTIAGYISNAFSVGNNNPGNTVSRYFLISPINRLFFSPRMNGAVGQFMDVPVSCAESCLQVAEFIQKGYGSGIDTKGTAADWYKKGVASSIRTMNAIAVKALSTTGFSGTGDTEIENYLNDNLIKLQGNNDLERIYIQQYLNFYRNGNEAYVQVRRTGYPKSGSAYYAREVFNEAIPRRWWINDPGEVNRANWSTALGEQGFTENAKDVNTLSTQRIWYDKNAPDFGKGN